MGGEYADRGERRVKKLDKQAFSAKASKIKENIKMPHLKIHQGKNSKEENSQKDKDTSKDMESLVEESQENVRQAGTSSGNVYQTGAVSENAYRTGVSQRNVYQAGTVLGSTYRPETSRRNLYQTGTISGNVYRPGTSQGNLYQTGAITGSAYHSEESSRNLYRTGTISGNAYQREASQRNVYQTGAVSENLYQPGVTQTSSRQAAAMQGTTVRRTRGPQRNLYQSDVSEERIRRTETVRRKRRQAGSAGENGQQQRTSQRNRRQMDSSKKTSYSAERNVRETPRTKISGAVAAYIKIALVAVLVLFIALDMSDEPDSAAQIETVVENVVKAAGLQSSEPAESRMVKRFYGLNPKDYEGAVLYAPSDNMDAHELFLVKLKDSTQKKTVEDAIEERLDTQLKSFEGYGAEQTALLEKHVLSVKGNYVLYVVGEYAEDAQKAFAKSL